MLDTNVLISALVFRGEHLTRVIEKVVANTGTFFLLAPYVGFDIYGKKKLENYKDEASKQAEQKWHLSCSFTRN
jgi:hypothetical protein